MHRCVGIAAVSLILAACATNTGELRAAAPHDYSDVELAAFLPTLADYAAGSGDSWVVQQQLGAGRADIDHEPVKDPHRVEPPGCDNPPFRATAGVAAEAIGREINLGPAGLGAEASIRIVRRPAENLLADARAWALRCRDTQLILHEDTDTPYIRPTAVSVLPSIDVDGVEVLRIHRTDNREQRYQTEGSRESVVSMAVARGVAVYGYGHDAGDLVERLMAQVIHHLLDGRPARLPRSAAPRDDSLVSRSDVEIAQLLPVVSDLPGAWTLAQALPVLHTYPEYYRPEAGISPPGCDAPPFMNLTNIAPRADLNRNLREVVTATAAVPDPDHYLITVFDEARDADDTVRLNIEQPGADAIAETAMWAQRCGTYRQIEARSPPARRMSGTVEVLRPSNPPGVTEAISVHMTQTGSRDVDFTASVLRLRGILVVTLPAIDRHSSPLLEQTLNNLRTADFTVATPRTRPPEPDYTVPPHGTAILPAPDTAATERLSRVATGTLVNSAGYHFGGYMPGDATVYSPQSLYFRSPTGSINCAFQQHYGGLTCDVPAGSYPRTPAPADNPGTWFDHYVHFDADSIQNGVAANLPRVYAEAEVLPYGHTIRLSADGPFAGTECLMERTGLTCVNYQTRVGLQLSRENFTPLVGTDALSPDLRPEP